MADVTISQLTQSLPGFNSVIPYSQGGSTFSTPPSGLIAASPGSIIQVKQTLKTDVFTTTSPSFVDVTGFSTSIKPTSDTNKILVIVDIGHLANWSGNTAQVILLRNDTRIFEGDSEDGKAPVLFDVYHGYASTGEHFYSTWHHTAIHLDNPQTTNNLVYKIQIRQNGGGTAYFNRSVQDAGEYAGRPASSLILMEVVV